MRQPRAGDAATQPEALDGAHLRFHQKLCLIRALNPKPGWRGLDAAEKLNTLRNRLAHRLDLPQIEVQVKDFLSLCGGQKAREEPNDPETEAELLTRLKRAIVYLCGSFEGLSVVLEAERRSISDRLPR